MAVLIEGYSVVVKRELIEKNWPGGWTNFVDDVPNKTLCADSHLARVGFMNYNDALQYCQSLEERGILETARDHDGGYVHVGQLQGLKNEAKWLDFFHVDIGTDKNMSVAVCRLVGDDETVFISPEGWVYEGSLSDEPNYVSNEEATQRLERIRRRDGLEVYYDKKTHKQVFVGRTGKDKKK